MVYPNLIPKPLWGVNLRKVLTPTRWSQVATKVKKNCNYTCMCCKRTLANLKSKKEFHAHELWIYDQVKLTATLQDIICVCSSCHDVIHIGRSSIKGKYKKSLSHLMKVNMWSEQDAKLFIEASFELWSQLSTKKWTLKIENSHQLSSSEISLFLSQLKN